MGKAEDEIENYLVNQVTTRGGLCWKLPPTLLKGIPDRLVVLNKTVFVETKATGKKMQTFQRLRRKQILDAGGEHFVIDTKKQVDDLIEMLLASERPFSAKQSNNPDHLILQKQLQPLRLGQTTLPKKAD